MNKGFTLTELLISISLMVLFTAILLPGFTRYNRRNQMALTAKLIESKLLLTRAYALSPRASGGSEIVEYEFLAQSLSDLPGCPAANVYTRYMILERTANDFLVEGPNAYGTAILCEDLPSPIQFLNPAGWRGVTFDVPDGKITKMRRGAGQSELWPTCTSYRLTIDWGAQGLNRYVYVFRSTSAVFESETNPISYDCI